MTMNCSKKKSGLGGGKSMTGQSFQAMSRPQKIHLSRYLIFLPAKPRYPKKLYLFPTSFHSSYRDCHRKLFPPRQVPGLAPTSHPPTPMFCYRGQSLHQNLSKTSKPSIVRPGLMVRSQLWINASMMGLTVSHYGQFLSGRRSSGAMKPRLFGRQVCYGWSEKAANPKARHHWNCIAGRSKGIHSSNKTLEKT